MGFDWYEIQQMKKKKEWPNVLRRCRARDMWCECFVFSLFDYGDIQIICIYITRCICLYVCLLLYSEGSRFYLVWLKTKESPWRTWRSPFWMCGTCSRAREHSFSKTLRQQGAPEPRPLRGEWSLFGRPNMSPTNKLKVEKANTAGMPSPCSWHATCSNASCPLRTLPAAG